jgi:hypothetical protein
VAWKERKLLVTDTFFFDGERVNAGLFNLAVNAVMESLSTEGGPTREERRVRRASASTRPNAIVQLNVQE